MAQKQGGGKKSRTHKISQGQRRSSRKVKLTGLELALLGKGPTAHYKPLDQRGERKTPSL